MGRGHVQVEKGGMPVGSGRLDCCGAQMVTVCLGLM